MLKLYSQEDLELITSNLEAGKLKFSVGQYRCFFGKQGKYLIQRIDNYMLGLTYDTEGRFLIFNYPHLNNIRDEQIAQVQGAEVQEKPNGTNFGFMLTPQGVVYRCRGSIQPSRFPNEINARIATGELKYVGIKDEIFMPFVEKYTPIFKEGQAKGYIDDMGNVNAEKMASELIERVKPVFGINEDPQPKLMYADMEIIGVFGELISKYNPIAVDPELRHGMYLDMSKDFDFIMFDLMFRDMDGNIYLSHNIDNVAWTCGINSVRTVPLKDITTCLSDYGNEEGVIIKGWNNNYYKMKHEAVISWARMMGTLSTVIRYSVEHIFSQGLGFSDKEILDGVLLNRETIDSLYTQAWEEVNANGITMEQLYEYYTAKKKPLSAVQGDMREAVERNLMMLVTPVLKENGVPKEKLYLEIPKYLRFQSEPLYYDTKKQRFKAWAWYGKLIGTVIGKVYLGAKY